MSPNEIRSRYVETIAAAFYSADAGDEAATTGETTTPWEESDESARWKSMHDARLAVDALTLAGLLPVETWHRTDLVKHPGVRERAYVTPWSEIAE